MSVLEHQALAPSLLLVMFLMSGLNKVVTLDKTIENLTNKLNIEKGLATAGIYGVILLEIIAPIIIIYHIMTKEYKDYAKYAIWSLVIFTIVVTVIYHPPELANYYKSIAFWANMSLLGGLLLLQKSVN